MLKLVATISTLCLAGCVTNISGKAAEKCAPVASDAEIYADCVSRTTAEMHAKNRNTARILAAGLGGAAQTPSAPTYSAPSRAVGFLNRSYVSGFNRICIYDELGSERAVTIGSTQMCPLSN
jgi:hypothetical protein